MSEPRPQKGSMGEATSQLHYIEQFLKEALYFVSKQVVKNDNPWLLGVCGTVMVIKEASKTQLHKPHLEWGLLT